VIKKLSVFISFFSFALKAKKEQNFRVWLSLTNVDITVDAEYNIEN